MVRALIWDELPENPEILSNTGIENPIHSPIQWFFMVKTVR